MAKKSKFFRVATEGDTTDGRVIERSWIEQAAKTFNQKTYGARVWLEHIRGLYADSEFRAYGDVTALKAEEVDGKMALFAQIDPTPELVEMNKKRQKIYTSIEINPNFANTGEAYMVGLAVTDSPASLGTEMLAFSANAKNNPLAARKQSPENVFTAAIETQLEWEEDEQPEGPSLFSRISDLLKKNREKNKADFSDIDQAVQAVAEHTAGHDEKIEQIELSIKELAAVKDKVADLEHQLEQGQTAFNELQAQLEQEPGTAPRKPATGGNAEQIDFA